MTHLLLNVTFASVWSKAWPIIVAILFFGLIIAIHEFGHFITAKLFKVKVNEFAIGMGPAIFKKKRGETTYALRLFPVGGYVSMEGEDETSEDERAFCNKRVWQKFIIVAAGAIMNLILGFIFVAILTCQSDLISTTYVRNFYDNSVSSQFGLEAGDKITEIDGTKIFSTTDISYSFGRSADEVQKINVIKDGKETQISAKPFDITVKRNGEKKELKNVYFETYEKDGQTVIIYDFVVIGVEKSFGNVITATFRDSVSYARLVWLSLFDLVTGHYGLNDLSGPVGTVTLVADTISDAAQAAANGGKVDLSSIYIIMAFISINIGIFNLMPIPALDGGRLFFLIIEAIRRKPIPAKYEGLVHAIGLILLLLLMVVISFNDILKLIKG